MILAALGVFGAAGYAPTAHAQLHIPPIGNQMCAPLVSVSYCSNPSNQSDPCWAFNNAACAQTLRSAFDAEYHRLTTTPTPSGESPHGTYSILLPDEMTGGGKLTPGARVSYDQSRINYLDYDLTYSSTVAVQQRSTNFGRYDLLSMSVNTAPLHPEWEVDGNAINDTDVAHGGKPCAEYVYKKYYDISRFEDAAASCKSDYICVYNLGVSTTTAGLNHYPLKKKQGTPMTVQLPQPRLGQISQQPKNSFWAIVPAQFSDWFAYRNRYDVYNGIGAAAHQVQPYSISSRWNWHVQMHDQQAHENLTLPQYEDMEVRTKNITDLFESFVAIRQGLVSAGAARDVFTIMNPHTVLQTGCADPIELDPNTGQPLPCHDPIHQLPNWTGNQASLFNVVQKIADALIAEWDQKSYADGTTVDHGCLDPSSNRCDWSPKMFAREYIGFGRTEREKDFQTCLDITQQVFSTANYPPMNPVDHSDTDHVESWMANALIQRQIALTDLPWTSRAGQNVVGRNVSGGKSLGDDDTFKVSYNYWTGYDAAFTRGADGTTICGVNGHAGGSFHADVKIPVVGPVPIIDAGLVARAGQNGDATAYANAHLTVLGASVYSTGGDVNAATSFNLSPPGSGGTHHPVGYDVVIMVGFVPVHLFAGVDFSTGVSWSVSGSAPQNQSCASGSQASTMSLVGNITPWADVSAEFSAAVGVVLSGFGAEAGVRGDLSILHASLPVNLSLSVGPHYFDDQHQTYQSLILNTNSSLGLTALSGSLTAYAEVCFIACESVEHEIFKWNGINLGSVDVFPSLSKAFPIIALETATPQGSR